MTTVGVYDRDDDLIEAVRQDGRARVRIERCSGTVVVIGRGGRVEVEVLLDAVKRDGVPLLRRRGGGCAVVLDPGNLVVSVVLPWPGVGKIDLAFRRISSWLAEGLGALGHPGIEQRGVSDLAIGDRKIGGSCIYRAIGLVYYSTTLLVDPDVELAERYLAHPPREPDYRAGRCHREFMGRLARPSGGLDVTEFGRRLEVILDPVKLGVLDRECRI